MKQMIRWSASFLAITLAVFTLATSAQAKGKTKPKPKIPFTGIVSVDTKAMTVTVQPMNSTATGTKTYKFNAATTITVNGQPSNAAGITPGQQIHVGLGMDGATAETLAITAPPADPK